MQRVGHDWACIHVFKKLQFFLSCQYEVRERTGLGSRKRGAVVGVPLTCCVTLWVLWFLVLFPEKKENGLSKKDSG